MTKKNLLSHLSGEAPHTGAPRKVAISDKRKQTIFMLNETAIKQLDFMALDMDTTRQALLIDAVNDLFKKHSKPPIA